MLRKSLVGRRRRLRLERFIYKSDHSSLNSVLAIFAQHCREHNVISTDDKIPSETGHLHMNESPMRHVSQLVSIIKEEFHK